MLGLAVLFAGLLEAMAAPASATPIFSDDFSSANFSNWTSVTRLTIDNGGGSPASPSARAEVTAQSAFAYRQLGSTFSQLCMSENVNVASGSNIVLLRLRTAADGAILRVFVTSAGALAMRSDVAGTQRVSGVALGSGWHNVEICGSIGTSSTWDLYRDGVRIVNAWQVSTGTTPVGRIMIGDNAAKTFTANFDHVVLDQAVGDEGQSDATPPTVPGQPAGNSPSPGTIQISWAASTDASPPITYRVYRDGGAAVIGTTSATSFSDTGLTNGSTHTYAVDAVDAASNASARSPSSASITVSSTVPQPGPGHTTLVPATARNNLPRIMAGRVTDIEAIDNRVFIVGNFSSIQNNRPGNTTTVTQPMLAAYNIDTGLVDTNFRPTFDGSVNEIEASPDGTRLYVVGRFNTVNGVAKRKVAALNPTTGATITGFTANASAVVESIDATNTTVYLGGDFTTVNGEPRVGLAAVSATTGQVVSSFVNNISGGIAADGRLTVRALIVSHDGTKLVVVHTGRQVNGQDRHGVALIDVRTNQVLPWHSSIWEENLQGVGGIQRIFAGAIAPNDQYFVVTSGNGGDAPPISDTAIAFPMDGGEGVQPLWITRNFDSIYCIAISEVAVYIGGHFQFTESPTAPDPWPGLDDVGYGTGQGLSGYGLGDEVVRVDHIAALDPVTGHALEWNPGSNSSHGNEAMLVTSRGLFAGGDGNLQGNVTTGRVAFYDLATLPGPEANESRIVNPIEGRVEEADVPFVVDGMATATSGVQRVQLEMIQRGSPQLWLQDDLMTWSTAFNAINATLASPGATSTTWSLPYTISGNRSLLVRSRTFGMNGSSESSLPTKKFETFGLADQTPTTSIAGPTASVIPTMTFTATGTAQDDLGVNSIRYSLQDAQERYLQDDGTVDVPYNAFRGAPDVVGATNATWSWEWTVPFEGEWKMQATAVDTAGQSDLRSSVRTWLVSANAIAPSISITTPAIMNPPTPSSPLTMAPGSPVTFSGSATDDQALRSVEISLRNNVTRESLASDGTWGTDVISGWYRITPLSLSGTSTNWSYTTPFNLRPGSYVFQVRATDNLELTTSSANLGALTINVQVPGDAFPDTRLDVTGTHSDLQVLQLDLTGTATDDKGVKAIRVTIQDRDSSLYVQSNGMMGAAFAGLAATLASPNATSTTWSLSVDLPNAGDYSVTAFAFDTSDQQDASSSGATARYIVFPGDTPPALSLTEVFAPSEGMVFTDARIFVSGRFEDDQQMASVQVAIRDSLGRYMSSSGTFTSTSQSFRTAFLNSPGSPGSSFAYTSPAIPAGAYTVFARGVDQHGFVTSPPIERNVIVQVPPNNPPVASFTYSCVQNVCTFDGRSSTDEHPTTLTYSWNFGNGSGSGPLPTRTYTSAGAFTVTLTVRDEYAATATASQTVTIVEPSGNAAPTPVISTPSCAGLTCNLSSAASTDPNVGDTFTRLWNFGDGTPTSTSTATSHRFAASGTYTVTLTVTDGWGRSATASMQITRTEPPTNAPPAPLISNPVCTGLVCSFSGIGTTDPNGDAMTYLWDFGDATATSTSSTPSHTYAGLGTYTVTLTVTDAWNRSATTARQVTVA
jgi:PKD repeat protein